MHVKLQSSQLWLLEYWGCCDSPALSKYGNQSQIWKPIPQGTCWPVLWRGCCVSTGWKVMHNMIKCDAVEASYSLRRVVVKGVSSFNMCNRTFGDCLNLGTAARKCCIKYLQNRFLIPDGFNRQFLSKYLEFRFNSCKTVKPWWSEIKTSAALTKTSNARAWPRKAGSWSWFEVAQMVKINWAIRPVR